MDFRNMSVIMKLNQLVNVWEERHERDDQKQILQSKTDWPSAMAFLWLLVLIYVQSQVTISNDFINTFALPCQGSWFLNEKKSIPP